MTDPVLRLEPTSLMVEPGGQARAEIHVRNPGRLVEGFRLDVLGETAAWASVSPSTVEVYPEQEQRAIIVFHAPGTGEVPSGSFPFGVRALSVRDQHSGDVAEGDLEIGRVFGLAPKLTPTTSSGRWKGRHVLTLTNWGNTPAHVHLAGSDPDDRLDFLIRPPELDLPLGAARTARVTVRTRRPTLRGTQQRLPFQIACGPEEGTAPMGSARPGDANRPVLDGAFLQRPIVSRGFVTILVMALLAAVASAFLLLRPASEDAPEARTGSLPPAPEPVTAVAVSAHAITVSWTRVSQAVGYRVFRVDPADRTRVTPEPDPVDREQTTYEVPELLPDTDYCFTVAAESAFGKRSPLPEPGCATTLVPTGNGLAPGPEQWIAVRDEFLPPPASTAQRDAQSALERLRAAENITPGILDTAFYPQLLPARAGRAFLVYEGPFDTRDDATAVCKEKPQCLESLPGPRVEPTPTPTPSGSASPPPGQSPDPSPPASPAAAP